MAWFNRRKQNTDVLPEEVREYYQTERRERTGMAWLLAIATLLATFIIAAGLFFGGRWVYRTAFHHTDNKTASNTDNGLRIDDKGNVTGGSQQGGGNPSTGTSSTSTSTPSPSNTNSSATSSTAGTNSGTATTPSTTPNTGPVELINTGPGDE